VSGFTARLAWDTFQAYFLEPFLEAFQATEMKTPAGGTYVMTRGARLHSCFEFELNAETRFFATLSAVYYRDHVLLLLEKVDVIFFARGERSTGFGGSHDDDLQLRGFPHEPLARDHHTQVIVFSLYVNELLLYPGEFATVGLDSDREILVHLRGEVGVVLLDPLERRTGAVLLSLVAVFHYSTVDIFEVFCELLKDASFLLQDLPDLIVDDLVGFPLCSSLVPETNLLVGVRHAHQKHDEQYDCYYSSEDENRNVF